MAKTKKSTGNETDPKKKTTKKSKKQEALATNPVDEFMKENEGKLMEDPNVKPDSETAKKPKKTTTKKKSAAKKPKEDVAAQDLAKILEEAEIVEVVNKDDGHSSGNTPVSEPETVEPETVEPETVEPETVEERPVEVVSESGNETKSESSDEVTVEVDKNELKQLFDKFKEQSKLEAKKTEPKQPKNEKKAIFVKQPNQPESEKVEKIPGDKAKRSFLNRVFSAMGLRQD